MEAKVAIPNDQLIITTTDLKNWGYSYYNINQMMKQGRLTRLNRMHYENMAYHGEESDFYYANAYVPTGVICLLSAAVHYHLTTFRPQVIDVAVARHKKVTTLPDWPTIKLYYFHTERYHTGIEIIKTDRNQFKIYNIEKTVIDIIYYRNKVGLEETKEILVNYLRREDRDINKLYRYGEKLKTGEILKSYLEVLL